MQVCKVTK